MLKDGKGNISPEEGSRVDGWIDREGDMLGFR
jgi:hypothetical protein